MTRALITGVGGQDGAYLAKLLLDKGYEVHGTSRDADGSAFRGLQALGVREQVTTHSMAMVDFRSVLQTLSDVEPDEIYNLAGQSSVGLSFSQPVETLESIGVGTLNLLEVMRFLKSKSRLYCASSSECFGDAEGVAADENTPFRPRSPYAMAKATAFWQVANYREAYGLHACSGILFNHESPLRPERFVTRKIVAAAARIKNGSNETLHLGNISVRRDWGWAPEYVEGMWRILQQDRPDDFVLATGQCHGLEDFIAAAFACVDLDWQDHVVTDQSLRRPTELEASFGNPKKAEEELGWKARFAMPDVVRGMMAAELSGDPASIMEPPASVLELPA